MTFGIATVNHRVGFSKFPFSRDITPRHQCPCGCESCPKLYDCDVGYSTINIDYKYNIIGVNFKGITADEEMDINDVFPYKEGMTQGASMAQADQIQVRVNDGYETYFLSNGKAGKTTKSELVGKWVRSSAATVVSTKKFKSGDGFWYISAKSNADLATAPYSVSVAGAVASASQESATLSGFYDLVSSPYPMDIPLNGGIVLENGTQGAAMASADQIQIRYGDGYSTYFLSNGKAGKTTKQELVGKWVKSSAATVVTEDKLPAGKGFWFIRKSKDTTLKFNNPLAVAE